jgi:o-succinylbenzoate synthase
MPYKFTYSIYQRKFRQPLITSHGVWKIRAGIIIQLTDELGRSQQGEIAPIEWFGSESIDRAIAFCQEIGDRITIDRIHQIPDDLPACQFGFGSAVTAFDFAGSQLAPSPLNTSALLPSGMAAIERLPTLLRQGYSTFKWKIGVLPIAQELAIWAQLITALPPDTKLRLDANGGLTEIAAERWLEICSQHTQIDFIEQPFAPAEIEQTIALAAKYRTPIALDESVATFDRLQSAYDRGWRGIYVIKPGIAGFPWRLAEFIARHQLDVVLSSVMETNVGIAAAYQLASSLKIDRPLGFGVNSWFED